MTDQSASAVSGDQEGIRNLLVRLKAQSLQLDFQFQREAAMSLVLKPYLDPITAQYLAPLPEEIEIAEDSEYQQEKKPGNYYFWVAAIAGALFFILAL